MAEQMRYAIYFVPAAQSRLYRFGCTILGYDCYTGETMKYCQLEWEKLTREPRRYGFHATLKAPFHLSHACTEAQLVSAFSSFAGLDQALPRITPVIRTLGGFAAIVPLHHEPAIDALAMKCTTLFDAFRAPMSAQERAKRVASGLNQSQIENLERWGYPFLFSDFRFHMTLTGKIPTGRIDPVLAWLEERFHRSCAHEPITIDRLALLRQDGADASFRVIAQVPLKSADDH
jgi:hypothetical protein